MGRVKQSWGRRAGAWVTIRHRRAYDYDDKRKLFVFKDVDDEERVKAVDIGPVERKHNILINVGRVLAHRLVYDTSRPADAGFNYVALTDDNTAPSAAGTTLTSEIAANGLTRAVGTVTPPTGAGTSTTVDKTFTATGTQSARQTALFTASSGGTMNHHAAFTQRNLISTDTIQITFTCSLGA